MWIRGLAIEGKQPAKLQAAVIWQADRHEDCKGIWEARWCSNFCMSIQQQADILHPLLLWQKCTGLSAIGTWALLICSQCDISPYIHNYSPLKKKKRAPPCALAARLVGLLKMLCGLTFHFALPETPSLNPGIFKIFHGSVAGLGKAAKA